MTTVAQGPRVLNNRRIDLNELQEKYVLFLWLFVVIKDF